MANRAPIEAHHIIPVDAFERFGTDIQKLFSLPEVTDFQQMGKNFIFLANNEADADTYQKMLENNKGLFGDVALGGLEHSGDHRGYNEVVKLRLERIFNNDLNLSPEQQKMMVLDLQRGLSEILTEGKVDIMAGGQYHDTWEPKLLKAFADKMNDALKDKKVYSPDNPTASAEAKANELLTEYNDSIEKGTFKTQIFGSDRSTDAITKYTANKMYDGIIEIDKATGFLSDQGRRNFENYHNTPSESINSGIDPVEANRTAAAKARWMISSAFLDTEKYLSAKDMIPKEDSPKLNEFISEFEKSIKTSLSETATSTEKANAVKALTDRPLDIKALKVLSDIQNGKNPILDLDNVSKESIKNTALGEVLNHLKNGEYDGIKINGKTVAEIKAQGGDFIENIHENAIQRSEDIKTALDVMENKANGAELDAKIVENVKNSATFEDMKKSAGITNADLDKYLTDNANKAEIAEKAQNLKTVADSILDDSKSTDLQKENANKSNLSLLEQSKDGKVSSDLADKIAQETINREKTNANTPNEIINQVDKIQQDRLNRSNLDADNKPDPKIIQEKINTAKSILDNPHSSSDSVKAATNHHTQVISDPHISDAAKIQATHDVIQHSSHFPSEVTNTAHQVQNRINTDTLNHVVDNVHFWQNNQRGAGNTELFREVVPEVFRNTPNIAQVDSHGRISLNPNYAQNFGRALSEAGHFGAKFGGVAEAVGFANNTFDSFMQGMQTGNWDNFQQQSLQYGVEAALGTVAFAVAAVGIAAVGGTFAVAAGTALGLLSLAMGAKDAAELAGKVWDADIAGAVGSWADRNFGDSDGDGIPNFIDPSPDIPYGEGEPNTMGPGAGVPMPPPPPLAETLLPLTLMATVKSTRFLKPMAYTST